MSAAAAGDTDAIGHRSLPEWPMHHGTENHCFLSLRFLPNMSSASGGSIMSLFNDSSSSSSSDVREGASRYDARIGGQRGVMEKSKGGCVNFILQISSICGQGVGGDVKKPKILRMSSMDAP